MVRNLKAVSVPMAARGFLLAAALSFADFTVFESYLAVPFINMYWWAMLAEASVFFAAFAFLSAASRRPRAALCALALASGAVGTANRYLYLFRGSFLRLADLPSIGTATSVARGYDFTPDAWMAVMWLVTACMAAVPFVPSPELDAAGAWIRSVRRPVRLLAATACAAFVFVAGTCMGHAYVALAARVASDEPNDGRFSMIVPGRTRHSVGTFGEWCGELAMGRPSEPDGYGSWESPGDAFVPEAADPGSIPDVVAVMCEAFSDPEDFGGAHATSEYMPFLSSFRASDNARLGSLEVSVIAGNTANTEFEYLTGASMREYPMYSVPYSDMVVRDVPSLARYFSAMGYETWAVHPHDPDNWNRKAVYARMGFDKSLFAGESLDGASIPAVDDPDDLMPDEDLYAVVGDILSLRERDGVPRFVFVVTAYNHGGYFRPFEGLAFDVRIDPDTAASLPRPDDELAMVKYLSLLKKSDAALRGFSEWLSARSDRSGFQALVSFFGDHQPDYTAHRAFELAAGSGPDAPGDAYDFYKVPYGVWATYGLPDGFRLERRSAIYAGADLFDILGRGMPDWYAFLSGMSGRVPVYTAVRAGTDGSAEADALVAEYSKRVWHRMSDPDGWAPGEGG